MAPEPNSDASEAGIERQLDYDGAETHECVIEGEVTRHYYDCPDCGFPVCAWMDCPECGWYDEDAWQATLEGDA